jgi:site-specific recombinase XerD
MSVYRRGQYYYFEFIFAGKKIKQCAKTKSKTVAKEAEQDRRRELERAYAGLPSSSAKEHVRSVSDVIKTYLNHYPLSHRPKSVQSAKGCLANVKRLMGTKLLCDLTEDSVRDYMAARKAEDGSEVDGHTMRASGRTINMELGELSRAIGSKWSILWPKVRKMEEAKDTGKALSNEEVDRLLSATTDEDARSKTLGTFVRIALLTGMRHGEILSLTWEQVDLNNRTLTVGRAKTAAGTGRQIPMNGELVKTFCRHAEWFAERFKEDKWGGLKPAYYLFPFGKPTPNDPTKPTTDITTAWEALRTRAGIECRFHDLRHTAATNFAEAGTAESTMLALMGHMSRAMLERYSHIRMTAKRSAVEALTLGSSQSESTKNSEVAPPNSPPKPETTLVQ